MGGIRSVPDRRFSAYGQAPEHYGLEEPLRRPEEKTPMPEGGTACLPPLSAAQALCGGRVCGHPRRAGHEIRRKRRAAS